MKICKRGLDLIQIMEPQKGVRICGWIRNNNIGSLLGDHTLEEIYHGERADEVRSHLIDQTYTDCPVDNCPYLANGTIKDFLVELEEIPRYPSELYLAFENNCNYNCTCCEICANSMTDEKSKDEERNYDIIEEKIRDILPHLTKIGANGRGELFCSPRTLRLLRDWKPLAPTEKISVSLETNGALFNEQNWKKIENLGQYHLRVAITVMSFQEDVYQYLSGTTLPISNIIDNLHYVKKLREEGIINELELATVMQEQNFREMPDFAERCLTEFGADIVRIRPIVGGGYLDKNIQWFMDVRNPHHPYYQDYKRVMQNPIFKHPKVLLWSGEHDSMIGEQPGILAKKKLDMLNKILTDESYMDRLKDYLQQNDIKRLSIYGIGHVGKLILRLNGEDEIIPIKELYDKYAKKRDFDNYPIIYPQDGHYEDSLDTAVLITVLSEQDAIKQELIDYGFKGKVIFVQDL